MTSSTRLLVLNAPNNPTGWTLTAGEQQAILTHRRRTGTWIWADEVYERLYFDAPCAPSSLGIAHPDDRLVVAHAFSKSFLMTGWRLGWLVLPPALVLCHARHGPVAARRRQAGALARHIMRGCPSFGGRLFTPGAVWDKAKAVPGSLPMSTAPGRMFIRR